jgi:perosamine synthetase
MRRTSGSSKSEETRRTFLKSTGAMAAGLTLATSTPAKGQKKESLALNGGPKAVTYPESKHHDAYRWPLYGEEEEQEVLKLLRRPNYAPVAAFEKDWKEYYQVPYATSHCNGTAALAAMFYALNLPPGSEVMVPSYTFFATIVPMRLFGLVPVFVDIHPHTLNFDLEDAKRRLTKNTKAVLPVHWIGLPAEMESIGDWAKQKGLIVLEDSAHAHGASLKGRRMGNWGRMAIFSYQTTKPLPTIEGGMGMYQQREDFERATTFGHYDRPGGFPADSAFRKYDGTGLGLKFRMHPVSAALGRCQLRKLANRNAEIAAQIRRLNDRILQLPGLYEQAYAESTQRDVQRIYYSHDMLFIDPAKAGMSRAACVKALQAEGVHTSPFSYRLQHKCPLYQEADCWHHLPTIPELPGSELANATAVPLPCFTSQVPELVDQYIKAFEKVWAHRAELSAV